MYGFALQLFDKISLSLSILSPLPLQALLVILERTSHWNELSRAIYTSAR